MKVFLEIFVSVYLWSVSILLPESLFCLLYSKTLPKQMKKVNKQCLLDTPRTVRVSEKTWQVIVQTSRP